MKEYYKQFANPVLHNYTINWNRYLLCYCFWTLSINADFITYLTHTRTNTQSTFCAVWLCRSEPFGLTCQRVMNIVFTLVFEFFNQIKSIFFWFAKIANPFSIKLLLPKFFWFSYNGFTFLSTFIYTKNFESCNWLHFKIYCTSKLFKTTNYLKFHFECVMNTTSVDVYKDLLYEKANQWFTDLLFF